MGLIKALFGATGGTLGDQWKEYFYCDSLDSNTLATRGQKRVGNRSSNKKGSDNIISDGSVIVVADGQCMMIVDQGRVVEFSAESGEFIYDKSSEPSIFTGNLGEGLVNIFKTLSRRFTFSGDEAKDQRVYYFNTKEILDNKFGTPNPIPFRVVDKKLGLDLDCSLRCSGVYSYRITDPMTFYVNLCGNMSNSYTRDNIDGQLRSEFISALQPSFGLLSDLGLRPYQIVNHTKELESALNKELNEKWTKERGITISSVSISSLNVPDEISKLISDSQRAYMMSSAKMAAGTIVEAQAEALKSASKNTGGAFNGLFGMSMAQNMGGVDISSLYDRIDKENKERDEWTCQCGEKNSGNFCSKCGLKRPQETKRSWICSCGNENYGSYCTNCGEKRPEKIKYRCSNCGYVPEDATNPPRFCPQCGDKFDEKDIEK